MIVNNTIINNGVDTSDATATEENIDSGYTAYVNGEKIVGSSTKNADTSGDTVSPEVLLEGYTAHDSYGDPISGYYSPLSLLNASVDSPSGDVTNLTIDAQKMNDRLMNINLSFDVEGSYISHSIVLTVSI